MRQQRRGDINNGDGSARAELGKVKRGKAEWSDPSPTNVFVGELVRKSDSLRLMLDGFAVDDRRLELLCDTPMDGIALDWVGYPSLAHWPGKQGEIRGGM